MIFPERGRVVVIDDNEKEAKPLLKALINKGHYASFFTGRPEHLPKKPLRNVRIVFLDLKLNGDFGQLASAISTVKHVLSKVVDKNNNGPFLVVAWTKHPQQAKQVIGELRTFGFQILYVVMRKKDYQNNQDKFVLKKIETGLVEKMAGNEPFELFLLWENLVGRATSNILEDFTKFATMDDNWSKNMRKTFTKISRGILGDRLRICNKKEVLEHVLLAFNSALMEEIASETRQTKEIEDIKFPFPRLKRKTETTMSDGKINSRLSLSHKIERNPLPGNVYKNNFVKKIVVKELVNESYLKNDVEMTALKDELIHIVLEVTPQCDHAERKALSSRLLPGLLWPYLQKKKFKKGSDFSYNNSPIIEYKDKLYFMVFDFRIFTSIQLSKLNGKRPIFMVQNELLADIQSRLASHVSRLGVVSI